MQKFAAPIALATAAFAPGSAQLVYEVIAEAPFAIGNGGESHLAVTKYTETTGVVCALDPPSEGYEYGQSFCSLIENGVVTDREPFVSTVENYGELGHMSGTLAMWCFTGRTNGYEFRCTKLDLVDGNSLEKGNIELGIKAHQPHFNSSVIAVAGFGEESAVACWDAPVGAPDDTAKTGKLQCGYLYLKSGILYEGENEGDLTINSAMGIKDVSADSALGVSIAAFNASEGVACYAHSTAGGSEVSCTALSIGGEGGWTLTVGNTVSISADHAEVPSVTVLSEDCALVCYMEGDASPTGKCAKLWLSGSMISKGDDYQITEGAISHLTVRAFFNETVVACYHSVSGGDSVCAVLDASSDALTSEGADMRFDDAMTSKGLELTSLSKASGLICYESTSGDGMCREIQVLPKTTTTETSSWTQSSTTTFATSSSTQTTDSSSITSSLTSDTSTTPHTTTETFTSTSTETTTPHTTTETFTSTTAQVVDSGAPEMTGAALAALVALAASAF